MGEYGAALCNVACPDGRTVLDFYEKFVAFSPNDFFPGDSHEDRLIGRDVGARSIMGGAIDVAVAAVLLVLAEV